MADDILIAETDEQLRDMVRQRREEVGLTIETLAQQANTSTDNVTFIEKHGVAASGEMLNVLNILHIEDIHSQQLARLQALLTEKDAPNILRDIVERGYNTVAEIEAASNEAMAQIPGVGEQGARVLTAALDQFHEQNTLGDEDKS